MRTEVAWVRV